MGRRAIAGALLAALGVGLCVCNNDYRDGAPCSSVGTCPPGQQCVRFENVCRIPCTNPGKCAPGAPCECQSSNNNNNGTSEVCDIDGFCRPTCESNQPGGHPGQNQCGNTFQFQCPPGTACDAVYDVCRPMCAGPRSCGDGLACVSGSPCSFCRPGAAQVGDGGMPPDSGPVASCVDGIENDGEADVDCGGGCPARCRDGQSCVASADCGSGVCGALRCVPHCGGELYDRGMSLSAAPDPSVVAVVAVGDLDGDGHLDLAITIRTSNSLSVFPGQGSGAFGDPLSAATCRDPVGLALGDLDGDGWPDLVVTSTATGGPTGPYPTPSPTRSACS